MSEQSRAALEANQGKTEENEGCVGQEGEVANIGALFVEAEQHLDRSIGKGIIKVSVRNINLSIADGAQEILIPDDLLNSKVEKLKQTAAIAKFARDLAYPGSD